MPDTLLNLKKIINEPSLHHVFSECLKLMSLEGRLLEINAAGLSLIEADNFQEVEGAYLDQLVEAEFRPAFLDLHERVCAGAQSSLIFKISGLKGRSLWMEMRASPVRDSQGEVVAVFGIARDITLKKNIEHALFESEQRFRTLIETIPQQVWTANTDGGISYVNQRTLDYFVVPRECIYGSGWELLIHPDDLPEAQRRWHLAIATGDAYEVEFRLRRADGDYRWHIGSALPLRDQGGKILQWFGTNTDISLSKQNAIALQNSERNLAAAQARAKIGSWQRDVLTNTAVWSTEMYRIFGFDSTLPPPDIDQIVARVHPEDQAAFIEMHAEYLQGRKQCQLDFRYPQENGEVLWIEAKSEPLFDPAENLIALTGTAQDISDRKRVEEDLATSRRLLSECQSIAQIGGWEIDLRTHQLTWTDETYRIHDTTPEEFNPTIDAGISYFLPESKERLIAAIARATEYGDTYDLELEKFTVKGRKITVRTTCNVTMHDGLAVRLTGIFQDITEQKMSQLALKNAYLELERSNGMLEHIAHYDALTHLPNRVLLGDRMQQAMHQCQRRGNSLAVAYLDLDGFKAVNDLHGHSMGDELLVAVAGRLRAALREGDTLARIGGDEFVAILTDLEHSKACEPVLKRLLFAASEPLTLHHIDMQVSASIGVTIYPQDGVDAEQLLRHADQAMYLSKQAGKNCFHLFDIAQDAAIKVQRDDLTQIQQAFIRREFVLYYQPKVNMRTGEVFGAEALIRWQHPIRGLLSPANFLPAVENHLFSIELGEWVIATALAQMMQWRAIGLDISVSVNVGALQLQQVDFTQRLQGLLAAYPKSLFAKLELEILESSALDDIEQVSQVIQACQAMGIGFALDDFGTGYSSLRYLKRLPAQILKIDQSFVRDMLEDEGDLTIIKGVIGLASAFHRCVIAEGVETVEHGRKLLSIGCDKAQGYGIARPMPAAAIPEWIKSWRPDF
ncbi:EAL domain-containing protein [Undibacterium sp. Ji22W]|uniref:EAL domain-containing protein n=1 Tax=Undibacterium sp. Ji22W TaxID=3413038 RepID=UPI003BF1E7B7